LEAGDEYRSLELRNQYYDADPDWNFNEFSDETSFSYHQKDERLVFFDI